MGETLIIIMLMAVSMGSSSLLAAALRRSWSLKFGFLGPITSPAEARRWDCAAARRVGRVRGSLWAEGSSEAPVSFWTTARKLEGLAWTKVVLGVVGEWRVELEAAMSNERERERLILLRMLMCPFIIIIIREKRVFFIK